MMAACRRGDAELGRETADLTERGDGDLDRDRVRDLELGPERERDMPISISSLGDECDVCEGSLACAAREINMSLLLRITSISLSASVRCSTGAKLNPARWGETCGAMETKDEWMILDMR